MRVTVFLLFLILGIAAQACGDMPVPPRPYVVSNDTAYFTMIPARREEQSGDNQQAAEAFGVAYRLNADGSSTRLWRVEGWYAFSTFISSDGAYLVRMGPWPQGSAPQKSDLAVAFYKDGVEIKSYSTVDLIKDPRSVQISVSHYTWRQYDEGYPRLDYRNRLYLKTVENIVYVFDATTGVILEEAVGEAGE